MQLVFDFPVSPRYSFDNFVVCGGNQTALQFARRVADGSKGETLLYIYGPPGSGKTHLLSALKSSIAAEAAHGVATISFAEPRHPSPDGVPLAEQYAGASALFVDDLHLMPTELRVELWQLFNDYYAAGRVVAITGLLPPRELPNIDEHLISRLLWGLVAKVDVSDDDSRRMIIRKISEDRQMLLPQDVIEYLLIHVRRDIPSLLVALDKIFGFSLATARKVSLRLAREALGHRS